MALGACLAVGASAAFMLAVAANPEAQQAQAQAARRPQG
jgi:hypothetical protein